MTDPTELDELLWSDLTPAEQAALEAMPKLVDAGMKAVALVKDRNDNDET